MGGLLSQDDQGIYRQREVGAGVRFPTWFGILSDQHSWLCQLCVSRTDVRGYGKLSHVNVHPKASTVV